MLHAEHKKIRKFAAEKQWLLLMDKIGAEQLQIMEAWVLVEGKVEKYEASSEHNITASQALFVVKENKH